MRRPVRGYRHFVGRDLGSALGGGDVAHHDLVADALVQRFGQDAVGVADGARSKSALAVGAAARHQRRMPRLDVAGRKLLQEPDPEVGDDLVFD
jgi:hypothetical protein